MMPAMDIQWFPGHMLKTQRLIQEHRSQVDVFLEVVDARAPLATANPLLDELLGDKPRVVLLNKIDLADPRVTAAWKAWYEARPETRAVLISCKERKNLPAISQAVNELCAGKKWFGLRKVRGMIVGVPNVGKSSLINALVGGKKASVANKPGHTKGLQRINISEKFDLFDTPGILWHKFDDPAVGLRLAFLGSVKDEILSVSDLVRELVVNVTQLYPQAFAGLWAEAVGAGDPEAEVFARIEAWGRKRGMLAKGGEVDWDRAFQALLSDFRGGKLGRFSLERPPVAAETTPAPKRAFDAIVFDFNGTLLWDMDLHEQVWHQLARQYLGRDLTPEEWVEGVVGRTNAEIWPFLLGREADRSELNRLSEEKERAYRDLLLSMPGRVKLVDGAEELFELCVQRGIRIAIGTAAGKSNVEFYVKTFRLDRWFTPDRIVYDDGTRPGKPDPALFSTAMARIGVEPSRCIVVEDGILGIRAARAAGAGKVYGIWADEADRAKLATQVLDKTIHTYREVTGADFEV